jgi:hypothetical protein
MLCPLIRRREEEWVTKKAWRGIKGVNFGRKAGK